MQMTVFILFVNCTQHKVQINIVSRRTRRAALWSGVAKHFYLFFVNNRSITQSSTNRSEDRLSDTFGRRIPKVAPTRRWTQQRRVGGRRGKIKSEHPKSHPAGLKV